MGKEYKAPEQSIDDISFLEPEATYSYADYLRWSFQERVELIKGKVFRMAAAPNMAHQNVSMNLSYHIKHFLLNQPCKVFAAPFDVRFPKKPQDGNDEVSTVIQPDLCVVCDLKKLDTAGCNGAPDLIIEILSPSTSQKDLTNKYELYEEHGVKEYWVVYPGEEIIEVFILESSGKYAMGHKYTNEDHVSSTILPGLMIQLEDIFIH